MGVIDSSTWTPSIQELVAAQRIGVIPYRLEVDYEYWSYMDIISSVLPEDALDEIPSGFNMVGHVAHLNLRDAYLPYKHLIAEVIVDKNPQVRTVINKIANVGDEDEFRTFKYEVLAGPDDLHVEINEEGCMFRFNYAKVYWNSKLNTEHRRLIDLFQEGEAVCDVMAGVGPFAIPAGKKHVFCWANDLNPDSYKYLEEGIAVNKVGSFVRPFKEDGRTFIRTATQDLYASTTDRDVQLPSKISRRKLAAAQDGAPMHPAQAGKGKTFTRPQLFSHYVMNLPASAITFLPSFIGLYSQLRPSSPSGTRPDLPLPLVHVYTFGLKPGKDGDSSAEEQRIVEEIGRQLNCTMKREDVEIFDVRDVAPKKRMFCASFRLPEDVAWRAV